MTLYCLIFMSLQAQPGQAVRGDPELANNPDGEVVPEDPYLFPRMRFRQYEVQDRSKTIKEPGPDTSDFPNSPYTLPAGRFYVEMTPFTWTGQTSTNPSAYNFQALYRYGLTDYWEFRVYTQGLQVNMETGQTPQYVGFNPITFDMKIHLQEEIKEWFIPALGLEAFIQTDFGSKELSNGVQPGLSLLANHSIGEKWNLNWNVGLVGGWAGDEYITYTTTYQASLSREITDNLSFFVHGYVNDAALPQYVSPISGGNPNAMVLGGGFLWTPLDRVALWGQAGAGVNNPAPDTLFYLGTAFAF
jgi:hypothetical protein